MMSALAAVERPARAPGMRLVGEYGGSGYTDPRYLVVRADGQPVHLTRMLYLVLEALDGDRDIEQAAGMVGRQIGRALGVDGLQFLVDSKLRPLGLIDTGAEDGRTPQPPAPRADPVLRVRLHTTLLPVGAVRRCGRALAPLFGWPVIAAVVTALLVTDGLLLHRGGLPAAMAGLIERPGQLLIMIAVMVGASLFHELGHAAGCHRGGGLPGRVGVGLYLIFPAFYTDVTDAYRLSRSGRLRTDLGGVYFSGIAGLAAGLGYLTTGYGVLLVVSLLCQLELVQQLLPVVRMDGYFILGDLTGVPDLFGRVRPILRGLIPGRPVPAEVAELRPRVRTMVTAWVVVVVPLLAAGAVVMMLQLPTIVGSTVGSWHHQWLAMLATWQAGRPAETVLALLTAVLGSLPVLGIGLLIVVLARMAIARIAGLAHRIAPSTAAGIQTRAAQTIGPADSVAASAPPAESPRMPTGHLARSRLRWTISLREDPMFDDTSAVSVNHAPQPVTSLLAGPADRPEGGRTPGPVRGAASRDGIGPQPDHGVETQPRDAAEPGSGTDDLASGDAVGAPTHGADQFTEECMLRPRATKPTGGWRRAVYAATRGAINPGPPQAEIAERQLLARARTPVQGTRRVVVISRKGGVGKTTTTLMLGHTFASVRGDRVVALDANPDAGNLGYRVPRETAATLTTLRVEAARVDRYADVRAYTSQAETRLEVIASDDDPRITSALGAADYKTVIDVLDKHYTVMLLDTGTGILDDAIQGILAEADQLVVVMPPALDGARVAASTLDWLDEHRFGALVSGAVAVVNGVRAHAGLVDLARVDEHFADRCAAVVHIPWDRTLEAGAQAPLAELRRATRRAYLELAAAVAEQFRRAPARR